MAILKRNKNTKQSEKQSQTEVGDIDKIAEKRELIKTRIEQQQDFSKENTLLSQPPASMAATMQFIDNHNVLAKRNDSLTATMMTDENSKRFSDLDESEMMNRFLGRR